MMCFLTAAIGYSYNEIQIDLNIRFRDQHYLFGVGLLVPTYRRENEQDKWGVTALSNIKWLCIFCTV